MITITLTRVKKAIFHPKAAFSYFIGHIEGQFLRFTCKRKIDLRKELSKRTYKNLEKHFIKRKEPKFFDASLLEELINQDFVIDNADRICNNEFTFLGINSKVLKSIKWNQDIKSGHIWSNLFYLDLREKLVQFYNKGWEIKMVWELSRFQYAVPLALAFYKTGEEKYLKKWQELILDWIEKNPVYFGPNWINSMEVAIRTCNWIFSWEIIKMGLLRRPASRNDKFLGKFLEKFFTSLVEHGRFIYRNLEYAPIRSNHYLSDIVGLVYLGIMFPEFKESKKWLKKGSKALEEEMKFQVYNDGVDYELSISYHRYVVELFLWAGRLCKENPSTGSGFNLSLEFWEKLKKMVEFSKHYAKPNGLAPQIGDADDARLHIVWEDFYNWEKRNHFALFRLYDYVFSNKLRDPSTSLRMTKSKSFSQSGFHIMRDKDFYLISGRNKCCYGKGGSHIHNDILSFELSMLGNDFIIDPGTYVYTPDFKARNRFRRTRAHNTVMIDHEEQNPISNEARNKVLPSIARQVLISNEARNKVLPSIARQVLIFKDPFDIEQTGELTVNQWKTDNQNIVLEAEHNCYERLRCSVVHNRTFSFNKEERALYIKDKFKGRGDHELEWNFHLSPEIKIWVKENKAERKEAILIGNNGSLIFSVPKILNCVIIEDKVSMSYGNKIPAKTIRLTGFLKQGFSREYRFSFKPLK